VVARFLGGKMDRRKLSRFRVAAPPASMAMFMKTCRYRSNIH